MPPRSLLPEVTEYQYAVVFDDNGWRYEQGYFSSLYHARLFLDAMPQSVIPTAGYGYVELGRVEIYKRPPPWRDPTICHDCGKKLPQGCGGANRDDPTCMWDQYDKDAWK